jgi:multifunctional beta-oxidation protein
MGGWAAKTRWQRAGGYGFPVDQISPEAIISKWDVITNFGEWFLAFIEPSSSHCIIDDGRATHPATTAEAIQQVILLSLPL